MHMQGTPSLMELKLQYYTLSIRYHEHDNNYLEICRCYKAIYETATVADEPEKWQPVRYTSQLQFASHRLILVTIQR